MNNIEFEQIRFIELVGLCILIVFFINIPFKTTYFLALLSFIRFIWVFLRLNK